MKHLSPILKGGIVHDKRACLLLAVLLVSTTCITAQSLPDTTLAIPEVTINASRPDHFRSDIKTDIYTASDLKPFAGESLGRFLISNSSLNLKSYGAGGALTNLSLRGSATSQVQVNWNGFPINSVTVGSCDFSMIPASGFENVAVVYGAPGALYGSGTFGGAINLDNNLKLGKAFSFSAGLNFESLRTIEGSASVYTGNDKVSWKGSYWGALSANEFTYFDYIEQSRRRQTDGKWNDAGTIQQVIFRLSPTSTLETGLWYQVKDFNVPSRIGSVSYEAQKDSTLKLFTAYKKTSNRWGLQVKAAFFNDYERYTQKASAQAAGYSIDSRISSRQYYGDANFRYFLHEGISLDAGLSGSFVRAEVSAYGNAKDETGLTAFAGARFDRNDWTIQTELRKEFNSGFRSGVLPSFGVSWKAVPGRLILRLNLSEKFRKPTFNDLYWMPGGNPGLKPESGWSAETGAAVTLLRKENAELTADMGAYWSQIDNMIVWRPEGAYWGAENYQGVRSYGLDGKIAFEMKTGRLKFHSLLMVMLNKSDIKAYPSGEQEKMLYSPRIITTWENRLSMGIFEISVNHHFSADRFYDVNSLLGPYQVINLQTGVRVPAGKGELVIHITVNNLTGTSYELIRLYPMPGRYWSLKTSYTF
ncbi:MAG TPA: TonB-dependent receptor plug domain-containing protein [Bacteroidales bacterium]|nr:TonB-dependent receptor plug domain-containing protein [Bacteroidales bacterium]